MITFQSLQSNVLDYQSLQDFTKNKTSIYDEFKEIPQVSVRVDEVPENCEDKNRYANVVPLPETRVHLQRLNDDEKTEYINANFVKVINYDSIIHMSSFNDSFSHLGTKRYYQLLYSNTSTAREHRWRFLAHDMGAKFKSHCYGY